jgi:AAA domain-containing protein
MLNPATPPQAIGIIASDLQRMKFAPLTFVIPGLIPEGLTLLAGKPKVGKSWLVLDCCLAVAYGGSACGSIQCEAGDAFYAAMEDNPRRLQRRLQQMLPDTTWTQRLCLNTQMPRTHEGGLDLLRDWAESVIAPRLIVIDTLTCIRPPKRAQTESVYEADYKALVPLRSLAAELRLAVVVVHHQRKMDSDDPFDTFSGTLGLTGAADNVIILNRSAGGTILYGRGRDVEDIEKAMHFDKTTARWSVLGEASDVQKSDQRKTIIEALRDGELSVTQLVAVTHMKRNNLEVLLHKMVKDGEVLRSPGKQGRYKLP